MSINTRPVIVAVATCLLSAGGAATVAAQQPGGSADTGTARQQKDSAVMIGRPRDRNPTGMSFITDTLLGVETGLVAPVDSGPYAPPRADSGLYAPPDTTVYAPPRSDSGTYAPPSGDSGTYGPPGSGSAAPPR